MNQIHYEKNFSVRLKSNPGKVGITTGKFQNIDGIKLIQVKFSSAEITYKPVDEVEKVDEIKSIQDLLNRPTFGRVKDLKNIITHQKIKGNLTNIFYSMESSNTDFYAHQFRPVLKFIETPNSKILLADEVGLGKTIEALYIWKELQARENARRLLIICPAHLRTKWQMECRNKFNIGAEIIKARELVGKIKSYVDYKDPDNFVYISSMQGLRPPSNFEDIKNKSPRSEFARICSENPVSLDGNSLFDLVIIDETHYLKNPNTANYRLGRLINDSSNSSVLLSATPIQIKEDNLYHILRLIYRDEFYDFSEFKRIFEHNKSIVNLQRNIWSVSPNINDAKNLIKEAKESPYFKNNKLLKFVEENINNNQIITNKDIKIEVSRTLEKISLFSQYMTRTRKREVDEARPERHAESILVEFTEQERNIYESITDSIKKNNRGNQGAILALIMRQRMLSSCIPAAIKRWDDKGFLSEISFEILGDDEENFELHDNQLDNQLIDPDIDIDSDNVAKINLKELETNDSKYNHFIQSIRRQLQNNSKDKIIVFSYFRDTIAYLKRRLSDEENIKSLVIIGGITNDEVDDIMDKFEDPEGPNILLSSDKGSEGIDLQFAHILFNYDLPWNPMKVEQRIGRIDRLGQKAEKLSIINFFYKDTIDERIHDRLFNRIELFKHSIGDMEEILGDFSSQIRDLLNPFLSEEEREKKFKETEQILINKRKEQERVEKDGILLAAFSDYILNEIRDSRKKGRWLKPRELEGYVFEFLKSYYSGSVIDLKNENLFEIDFSQEAKTAFGLFLKSIQGNKHTNLNHHKSTCLFDSKKRNQYKRNVELIDPSHPIIKWIKEEYNKLSNQFHKLSLIKINKDEVNDFESGEYFYLVSFLSFKGLKKENILMYQVVSQNGELINEDESENFVNHAVVSGKDIFESNFSTKIDLLKSFELCEYQILKNFSVKKMNFNNENENICNIQETRSRSFYERKISDKNETILKYQNLLKNTDETVEIKRYETVVNLQTGQLKKFKNELDLKLQEIKRGTETDTDLIELSSGVIKVT